MLRYCYAIVALLLFGIHSNTAFAKDFPVQARFFTGITSVDPKNVNETIEAQGLKKIDGVTQLGFEATYPLMNYLNVGIRYTKRLVDKDEEPADPSVEYNAKMEQDSVLLVARVPIMKSDIVRVDGFAGVGGTNTTLGLKTISQDGELTRRESGDWFASPYAAVGGSVAIGYKKVFLVIEGGYETNKVDGFKRSGTVSSNVDTLDLSGSYVTVGLLIDGLTGSTK